MLRTLLLPLSTLPRVLVRGKERAPRQGTHACSPTQASLTTPSTHMHRSIKKQLDLLFETPDDRDKFKDTLAPLLKPTAKITNTWDGPLPRTRWERFDVSKVSCDPAVVPHSCPPLSVSHTPTQQQQQSGTAGMKKKRTLLVNVPKRVLYQIAPRALAATQGVVSR